MVCIVLFLKLKMVIPNLLGLNSGSLPDLDPAESNILLILDPVVISGKKQKKKVLIEFELNTSMLSGISRPAELCNTCNNITDISYSFNYIFTNLISYIYLTL